MGKNLEVAKLVTELEARGDDPLTKRVVTALIFLDDALTDARTCLVSGYYENEYPAYSQGSPTEPLQELMTADEANRLVAMMKLLKEELEATKRCLLPL